MTRVPNPTPESPDEPSAADKALVLLVLEKGENARLLAEFLGTRMLVAQAESPSDLDGPWDIVVLDAAGVALAGEKSLKNRKDLETPITLPYLLLVKASEYSRLAPAHWELFDEIFLMPVPKAEFLARLGRWLRVRRMTQQFLARQSDLEVFAGAIAHELRAPLRAVDGFVSLAMEGLGDQLAKEVRSDLEKARSLSVQGLELANRLLDLATLGREGVHLEPWSARIIVAGATHACQGDLERTGAVVEVLGDDPVVMTDAQLAQVVLVNLLSNALKFQPAGVVPHVRIHVACQGQWCRFSVEDNGIGIPPEHLKRLFRPFARVHGDRYPGSGLGLAAVAKLARLLNARLGVSSSPGQGSTFWIELPCVKETGNPG